MSLTQLTILPEENNCRHPSPLCAKINFSYIIILNIPDIEVVEAGFEPRSVSCLCATSLILTDVVLLHSLKERRGEKCFLLLIIYFYK